MSQLSPRQQSIFYRVVDTHIETAQPVGSKSITELYNDLYRESYSSATVRHEMGLLEGMGYLTHPHTSAGRVPTDQGYRYYVNHQLEEKRDLSEVEESFEEEVEAVEDQDFLAEKISRKLSKLSGEVALVIIPVKGTTRRFKLYLQGSSQIMEKPEFQNVAKVQSLLKAFEETEDLITWLTELSQDLKGTSVSIGHENPKEAFHECAIVASHCRAHEGRSGMVAVVGPRRMRYAQTIPLVQSMAKWTGKVFFQKRIGPFYG